jgi:hypothetical protein
MREIESCLLRCSSKRWPEWRRYALGIQAVCFTLDEQDDSRTVGQIYRPVLLWYCNNSRRQSSRYGSKYAGCADTHEYGVVGAVDRRCDPGGGCFQTRQPLTTYHFRWNHNVVAVGYAMEEPFFGQSS